MNRPTDFVAFYQQLGLRPDCGLAELKNAYRRRVAGLHPDRNPQHRDDAEAAARLQELTAAYQAALAFERRHGRLPGARAHAEPVPPGRAPAPDLPQATRRTGLRRAVFALLAAAPLAWVIWDQIGQDGQEEPAGAADTHEQRRFVAVPPPAAPSRGEDGRIELGMDAASVRAIEGRPVMENIERWDYGPSWIEFDHGRVSDWYSSRLRPLKVASARPAPR